MTTTRLGGERDVVGGGQTEENSQSCEQMVDPARCQQTNTGGGRFLFLVSPEGFSNWKEANSPDQDAVAAPSGTSELALARTWRERDGAPALGEGAETRRYWQ